MGTSTKGIHHITAIASDAQKTVHFYCTILGLRLVKKTVNQDDVGTYHLFFGDKLGHPGMDLTFFIFQPAMPGRAGNGLVTTISFAVPEDSLAFWKKRLENFHIKQEELSERFGKKRLVFFDYDGQTLEFVGVPIHDLDPSSDIWTSAEITTANAIRSFYAATLSVISRSMIDPILTQVLGYTHSFTEHHRFEYMLPDSRRAQRIEVDEEPSAAPSINAAGTVHHIAFRATNHSQQAEMRNQVIKYGLFPTERIDRFYFQSVYFRTPGGILFEIATDRPGFTVDETPGELGKKLALPPFLEHARATIEQHLPPLPVTE